MQPRRLVDPGVETAGATVTIYWHDRPIQAVEGESIAAALTANAINDLRLSRDDRPHGQFCGMGVCHECLIDVDGRLAERACMTLVRAGMRVIRNVHAAAAVPVQALVPPVSGKQEITEVDCAVVGAGPAGLAAATAAAHAGASVVLLDERTSPGGQYLKALAGSHRFVKGPVDRQFSEREKALSAALDAGATLRNNALVWIVRKREDGFELGIFADGVESRLRSRTLVLAQGAYEKPHPVPGWTLPGVMTTGAAQTLARSYRVASGERILIAGNGPLNLQVASEIVRGGGHVVGVVEAARLAHPAGVVPALRAAMFAPRLMAAGLGYRARLASAGVRVIEGSALIAIEGEKRAEAALVAPFNQDGRIERSRAIRFEVDTVCLGYGFLPNADLARMLAVRMTEGGEQNCPRPDVDEHGRTSVAGLFCAGDGAGIEGAVAARHRGTLAGLSAASLIRSNRTSTDAAQYRNAAKGLRRARAFQHALWTLFQPAGAIEPPSGETVICRCEEVTVGRVAELINSGMRDLGSIKHMTRLGMGRCQGRYCSALACSMLENAGHRVFMTQAPAKPLPIAAIAREKAEWKGHREVTPVMPDVSRDDDQPRIPQTTDLVIVGGGIIGTSTALAAAEAGMDVVVLERREINSEASGGNAGSLHVQLLSYDFGERAQAGGGPALGTLPLQQAAALYWRELETRLQGDFEIAIKGGLMVAESEADLRFLAIKADAERRRGIDVHIIDSTELRKLAPNVAPSFVGAAFCPEEGKVNPLIATHYLADAARRAGARIEEGAGVITLERNGEGYRLNTARGAIDAARLLLACGGWTAPMGRMLGLELPVSGAPLQMIVTEPAPPLIDQLLAHARRRLTLKQATNGNLIIGGGWSAMTDSISGRAIVDPDSMEGNAWVACRTLPAVAGLRIIRSWAAMNVNVDGAPLVGAVPGHPNLWVAATANGYTLGPLIGRELGLMIRTGRTPARLSPFGFERFR
ncbi:MAG: FAD-dependent oxidoreductase [Geminicoccaceae bacterium]